MFLYQKENGKFISCYGDLEEDSNIIMACDGSDAENVFCGAEDFEPTKGWKYVCEYMLENVSDNIVQLETC